VQIRDGITEKGKDGGDGIKEDDPIFPNISQDQSFSLGSSVIPEAFPVHERQHPL
jgi:hypothetical protein